MKQAPDDVVDRITLQPDSALVHALGTHHSLESSVADLIDNSIDAGATKVVLRLLTEDKRLVRVDVADNGHGMDGTEITAAMTLGKRRAYDGQDLGHFGMGLKAASLGHADVLTVWSQRAGATAVGRRLRKADFSRDFSCEVLSGEHAADAAAQRRDLSGGEAGTLVTWTELARSFRGQSQADAIKWLHKAEQRLRSHLAVTFHRLLERGRLQVFVVNAAVAEADVAVPIPVGPIDPLGYPTSGHPAYPKDLLIQVGGRDIALTCHIWPPKQDRTGFRVGNQPGEEFQGFLVYRNDRLLQFGGWGDVATASTARQLARVVLDDPAAVGSLVTMNPEKQGLRFDAAFTEAIGEARASDGTTFADYLETAESVMSTAQRRVSKRRPAVRPDRGFAKAVRTAIEDELPMIEGREVDVKWRRLPEGELFDVEFRARTLWLNSHYREMLAGSGGMNDAPLLKALMYLLTRDVFNRTYLGSKDRDNIEMWKSVLGAAVEEQESLAQGRSDSDD